MARLRTWHRPRNHIAPNYDVVYFCLTNFLEHNLQCGKVPVNVIDCSDPHHRSSSIEWHVAPNSVRRERQRLVRLLYPDPGMLGAIIHHDFHNYSTAPTLGRG